MDDDTSDDPGTSQLDIAAGDETDGEPADRNVETTPKERSGPHRGWLVAFAVVPFLAAGGLYAYSQLDSPERQQDPVARGPRPVQIAAQAEDGSSAPANDGGGDDDTALFDYDAFGFDPDRGVNWSLVSADSRSLIAAVPNGSSLALRDLPSGSRGTKLVEIGDGAVVRLTGCLPPRPEDGGRWCQTTHGGAEGWVYDVYLTSQSGYGEARRRAPDVEFARGYSSARGVNWPLVQRVSRRVQVAIPDRGGLAVRHVPSGKHGRVLARLPSGTQVQLTSCLPPRPEDRSRWCQMEGRDGWVYDTYLVRLQTDVTGDGDLGDGDVVELDQTMDNMNDMK